MRLHCLALSLTLLACGGDPAAPPTDPAPDASGPTMASRCVATPSAPDDPLVVVTEAGEIRGTQVGDTRQFLGIPYAAPPVGDRRFRAPEPAACWSGVRPAIAYGDVCPQILPSGSKLGREDCLFANVFAPATPATAPRPVLVFIHGGAYEFGSGNQDLVLDGTGNLYDGSKLAAHDAIVVTINYRLGALGFLAHPALTADDPHGSSGNYGTLDQIAALQWVHDNIASFGGDPARVMIFGESAGGLSTCLLVASPLARGLFSAAIMESGGCRVAERATRYAQGESVASNLGCRDGACLRAADVWEFFTQIGGDATTFSAAMLGNDPRHMWEMMHGPNLDGYAFVEQPLETYRAGRQAKVPFIVGSNANEGQLFVPPFTTAASYYAFLGAMFGDRASDVADEYPWWDYATPREAAVAAFTDHMFTCEGRRVVRAAHQSGSPVRRYFFRRTFAPPHPLAAMQSFHTAELPFVFGTFDVLAYAPDADDAQLSAKMQDYWTTFAATGDLDASWPRYNPVKDDALVLDMPLATKSQAGVDHCAFWDAF